MPEGGEPKHDSQHQLRSPMPEGGEPKHLIATFQLQYRYFSWTDVGLVKQ
jgi:hypothetical protein